MTNTDKPFKTLDEQISILESRNLSFITKDSAKAALRNYGYYEIINGYKDDFILDDVDDNIGFKKNSTFEHIYAMYKLDNKIRNTMRESLEKFEQTFKQSIAYIVSRDISELQERYTAPSHYNAGKSHRRYGHKTTDRNILLNKTFKNLLHSSFEPYEYYRTQHNNIPPWILAKGLSFGNTIYWFSLSKKAIREKIIARMIGLDVSLIREYDDILQIKRAFGDVLKLYLDYRNLSSHCGRLYNHRSEAHKIRNYSPFIYKRDDILNLTRSEFLHGKLRSSIGTVLQTLNMFENKDPFINLEIMLEIHLKSYLKNYPEDFHFLIDEMELNGTYVDKNLKKEKELDLN